ncbi:GNAT family N-acetyltransferase [Yinghuangia soli]|uniref:GNAT family N-acetyltransferase n=1 Tax=Yinghuangia soli TaxID=2908204 RepID=A0AA41Q1K8_9ACTN|nr:GNAT family N-acetyltransferase [Yinghuangia soli]MCF2529265.1 GNAT family N-acetyltransferase [Yinghuangia soli]
MTALTAPAGDGAAVRSGFAVHRAPDALAAYEDGWRELAAATPGASYFGTPDWVLAAWEDLGAAAARHAETAVWTAPDGTVEAVLPLLRTRGRLHPRIPLPVRHWTLLGLADAADHGVLLAAAHRRDAVRAHLRARTRNAALWLPALDPEADTALLPAGCRLLARETCPRLAVGGGRQAGSAGFRRLMRRRTRQLEADGVTFRWVPPEAMTAGVFDTVAHLHRVRREHLGTPSGFDLSRRDFHVRLMARAAPGRGPAAMLAERGGEPVGAVYGFLWGDTFAYYNGGWDPAFARLSLGTVLLDRTITATADEAGARHFDFLRGGEAYKYASFGADDRFDEQWLLPRGPSARLAGAILRTAKSRKERR